MRDFRQVSMDIWTWIVPVGALFFGFTLSDRDHKETQGKLADALKRNERLKDELDVAKSDLERAKNAVDSLEELVMQRGYWSKRGKRYAAVIAMLKRSKARANAKRA